MSKILNSIDIVSLNIEGHRNLELVIPFLESSNPDVILLQEVFQEDLNNLSNILGKSYIFAPMCKRPLEYYKPGKLCFWGVAILFNSCISTSKAYYHKIHTPLPFFGDGLIGQIEPVIVFCTIKKNNILFNFANTHFPWSPNGQPSNEQLVEINNLFGILKKHNDIILTGDFNAPRGGEIFEKISSVYTDWIPSHIKTTIDKDRHKSGDLQLVVDGLFSTNNYQVDNVRVINGVSDHCAIQANIIKVI